MQPGGTKYSLIPEEEEEEGAAAGHGGDKKISQAEESSKKRKKVQGGLWLAWKRSWGWGFALWLQLSYSSRVGVSGQVWAEKVPQCWAGSVAQQEPPLQISY